MNGRWCVGLLLVAISAPILCAEDGSAQLKFFENEIRPLLHANCIKCHGEKQQKGGLRLDSIDGLLKGGESGPAIDRRHPEDSLLLSAIRYDSFEMPPTEQMSADKIAAFEKWIRTGAAWPKVNGAAMRISAATFSDEDRNWWSLQPIQHFDPPKSDGEWAANPIDQFVEARLAEAAIRPAPQATPTVLIRRLYFDLLGVPPSPADLEYAQSRTLTELIDHLLADRRYGEHWGRHWLDLVRYAESDGFRADFYRENAWRFRDYVIQSFNDDKPYDVFVMEQLAGDEIAADKGDALVATGYLRTYLYEYNQRDARTQWQDILTQVTDVTGEVFLGIGVGCARCHDHKFDPILQEDYYRLRTAFSTMIPRDDMAAVDELDRVRHAEDVAAWKAKSSDLQTKLEELKKPYRAKARRSAVERFPEDIQVIMAKAADQRTALETQLADLVLRQVDYDCDRIKMTDEDKKQIESLEQQITELAGTEPKSLPKAMAVTDVGRSPFPLHVGNDSASKQVSAGGFSILDDQPFELQQTAASTGQRTALAEWITSAKNPLTARVIVNRIWQQHFGSGLVSTTSDFGRLGDTPSHPKLLDWLATQFVNNGWSIKWLHRMILNSSTWQMSAFHPDASAAEAIDPGNRMRWRFDVRRLTAEQIRDAMLAASGELQSEYGGSSVAYDQLRRSIYLKMLRNKPESLMSSLDGVDGLNSVSKRSTTTTPTQALNLINGSWVRDRAKSLARRVIEQTPSDDSKAMIQSAFQIALSRSPNEVEIQRAIEWFSGDKPKSHSGRIVSLGDRLGKAVVVVNGSLPPVSTAQPAATKLPFTVSAVFHLNSLYEDGSVRTIVSDWDGSSKSRGWSLGVTSLKSAYQPRNLILQVKGESGYEVIASGIRPELDRTYHVSATVTDVDGASSVTFSLHEHGDSAKPQTKSIKAKPIGNLENNLPIVIGGRAISKNSIWDGVIDEVAVFDGSVATDESDAIFRWTFDDTNQPFSGTGTQQMDLAAPRDAQHPLAVPLTELCHVLLNTNEFVYID